MIEWRVRKFGELSVQELYSIMRLREEVFVVEQNCVFVDADGKDPFCHHLWGMLDGAIVAYARLVPAGVSYPETSLGRIVTAPACRHKGYGRLLMECALKEKERIFGPGPIKIEAQLYLKKFYEEFRFAAKGEPYMLDNILHIVMVRL